MISPGERTHMVNAKFPTSLLHDLDRYARRHDKNRSEVIRAAIAAYIDGDQSAGVTAA